MSEQYARSIWLFPGQGAQEIGMGRPVFGKFAVADEILQAAEKYSGHPLKTIMSRGPETTLTQTDVLQPALVAVSLAYVELLRHARCTPVAVAGHSLGEIPALYAAGVIELQDALRLATERGRLMSQAAEGAMMAIKDISPEQVEELLQRATNGVVVVANYNAPSQTVVSGESQAIDALPEIMSPAGGTCIRLNVSGAWHSPLVQSAARSFEASLDAVKFSAPQTLLALGVTGKFHSDPEEIREIMRRQIASPVRWIDVTNSLWSIDCRSFLEVGPGKVLRGLLRKNIEDENSYTVGGLDNSKTVKELLSQAAGTL